MKDHFGPTAIDTWSPLAGLLSAREGGLAAPLGGTSQLAAAPLAGGLGCEGGATAACIVNSGQKLKTPKIYLEGSLSMVGVGDECEPEGWTRVATCPSCGYSMRLVKHGCGRITCPVCSKKWARRAAERSSARLFGAFLSKVSRWKPRHITFDLDECSWGAAKKKALELGCTGGVLVLHPWRLKDEYKQMFELMAERTGINRYDIAKMSAIGMDAFRWSPHCHALTYGKFADVRKGSEIFQYRNVRRLNSQHIAEGTLMYLFSHTFVPPAINGACYRYFGICSPQKLKPVYTGTCNDWLRCPCCDEPMREEGGPQWIGVRRYIALGWHVVTPGHRKAREAPGKTKNFIPPHMLTPSGTLHSPKTLGFNKSEGVSPPRPPMLTG